MREEKRCKICPMTLPQPIKSSPSWGRLDGDIFNVGKIPEGEMGILNTAENLDGDLVIGEMVEGFPARPVDKYY